MPVIEEAKPAAAPASAPAEKTPPTADAKTAAKQPGPEAVPQEKAEAKVEPKESQRFAALARKERALVEESRKLSQAREQLTQQYQAIQAFEEAAKAAKLNPVGVLQALGVSQEELGQFLLNGGEPAPENQLAALQAEIEGLKSQRQRDEEAAQLQAQQAQQTEEQKLLTEFQTEVATFVKTKPDDYEFVLAYGQEPLVAEVIREAYEQTGELIEFKQAADMVEEHLSAQIEKAAKLKKFVSKFATPSGDKKPSPPALQAPTRTLTNQHSASTPTPPRQSFEDERMARALAAAEAAKSRA
jgi:hypothetical protein